MDIRQSSLQAFSRCPQEAHLESMMVAGGDEAKLPSLSTTTYGSVVHYAAMVLLQRYLEQDEAALQVALDAFDYYWEPSNVGQLPGVYPITEYLPRTTWYGLKDRGHKMLRALYEYSVAQSDLLIALEVQFRVPIDLGDAGQHVLTGTADRLSIGKDSKGPLLRIEDYKGGKKKTNLRWNVQWTMYAYASQFPEFWSAWDPAELERIVAPLRKRNLALFNDGTGNPLIRRKGSWISLNGVFGFHDCGFRVQADYRRLEVALREYVRVVQADIWPLNLSGDTCFYCPFARNEMCGGVSIAEDAPPDST